MARPYLAALMAAIAVMLAVAACDDDQREAAPAPATSRETAGGVVHGRVYVTDSEQTPQDAGMLVVPTDAAQPIAVERSVPNGDINLFPSATRSGPGFLRAGANGVYSVTDLATGDYFVGATDSSSEYEVEPPEVIQFSIGGEVSTMRAFRVQVTPGEITAVDIVFAGPREPEGPSSFRVCVSSFDPQTLEPGPDRIIRLHFEPAENIQITLLEDGCAFVDNVPAGTYAISYDTARGFSVENSLDIGPGEHGGQINLGVASPPVP